MSNTEMVHPRNIKSFAIRSGRMTAGQLKAYEELWVKYGIDASDLELDFSELFSRPAPVIIEIGFGMGDSLIEMAGRYPENNYLGIDVHKPGVGRLLGNIVERNLSNLRVMRHDAVQVLKKQIKDRSLHAVYLFFPDPWHKRRHHKRRIVKDEFVQLVGQKLEKNGYFHMATDWEHYALQMLETMNGVSGFKNCATATTKCAVNGGFIPRPDYRPMTKFEHRGKRLGHRVWDILFKKT
jgi:tRNA (guanine-N7-)-methyltransferase